MICHVPVPEPARDLWVSEVEFTPAAPEDIDCGLLGWVYATVCETMVLCGMRVRRLSTGRIKIKVRRGCRDLHGRLVGIDERARARIERLILADEEFRAELAAVGVQVPEATDA